MKKWTLFAMLGLAGAMIFATPSKANAQVVVGVRIGHVVPRPGIVAVAPRPYYPYVYHPRPRPVVFVPPYVRPVSRFYYRGRVYPRPYGYRPYYGPRYFRR
jgi:hypothetical protein